MHAEEKGIEGSFDGFVYHFTSVYFFLLIGTCMGALRRQPVSLNYYWLQIGEIWLHRGQNES